jgi:hypothetical protein
VIVWTARPYSGSPLALSCSILSTRSKNEVDFSAFCFLPSAGLAKGFDDAAGFLAKGFLEGTEKVH